MPELFTVRTPPDAWTLFLEHFRPIVRTARIATQDALGRILAEPLASPQDLPEFPRSTVDGYAVTAADTYGATPGLPAFLAVVGEVPMGHAASFTVGGGEAALVHTGGMIPPGADAVVMVENTQQADAASIEVMQPVAEGQGVVRWARTSARAHPFWARGAACARKTSAGCWRWASRGAVAVPPRVAILSTGDEVVAPDQPVGPGQVRDINSYTLAALTQQAGGEAVCYGIVPDDRAALAAWPPSPRGVRPRWSFRRAAR